MRDLVSANRRRYQQRRLDEITHLACHDERVAVRGAASIEQSDIRPDIAEFRGNPIRHGVKVVASMNIPDQHAG